MSAPNPSSTLVLCALLLAAAAAHHYSSTPPKIAAQESDHLLKKEKSESAASVPGSPSSLPREVAVDEKTPLNGCANGAPRQKETLHDNKDLSRYALKIIAGTKHALSFLFSLEFLTRLLFLYPSTSVARFLLPILLPASTLSTTHLFPPATLSTYLLLSILFTGAYLRHRCFVALGRHFSFTHTTLQKHTLIASGPYAVVRHPSYTGEILVRSAAAALILREGAYARLAGALNLYFGFGSGFSGSASNEVVLSVVQVMARTILLFATRSALVLFLAWNAFNMPYLLQRAPREDAALRAHFGAEWDAYASKVPKRFVPGLI